MGRLLDIWRAATGRKAEVKALPGLGGGFGAPFGWSWDWSFGFLPGSPGVDYGAVVGDVTRNGTVSICLRWLEVNALSGPRLCAGPMDKESGKYDSDPDHPMIADLKRPNPYFPSTSLLANTIRDLCYPGFSYWIKSEGPVGEREYYWVPRRYINPVPASAEKTYPIEYYEYTPPGGGTVQRYRPDQIVHFRFGQDPYCLWQGHSALAEQLRSIAALNAGEAWTAGTLRKGHRGTLISPKDGGGAYDFTEALVNRIRKMIFAQTGGDEAGGIAGVPVPLDTEAIGFSPEEALIDRILDRPEGMVLAACGLNSLVTGLPSSHDTRTYSNLGEAKVQAAEYALKPLMTVYAETLQQQVLPDYEGTDTEIEVWWDYSEYTPLQEDQDARSQRAVAEWEADLRTFNEAREALGLSMVDDERGEQFKSEMGMDRAQEMADMQSSSYNEGGDTGAGGSAYDDPFSLAMDGPPDESAKAVRTRRKRKRAKQRISPHVSGGPRKPYDESLHPRRGGRFVDKPGAGNDAPKKPRQQAAPKPSTGTFASEAELLHARSMANKKVAAAPVPPREKVVKMRAALERAKADPKARAGGDARGSSADRKRRAQNLFAEFGGNERGYVVCHGTGLKMHWSRDPNINPNGYPVFEQGKIFTARQGGSYTAANLLPESFKTNRSRNDAPVRHENLD